jgi:1,4-alpha-glucan branching enzyme
LGNDWSYHYARRQWSLTDKPELRYHQLADWDRAMINLIKRHRIMSSEYPRQLWLDEWLKTLAFERNGLVFVFNWHVSLSPYDYEILVPQPGRYRVVLNSDAPEFGGFDRIDPKAFYDSFATPDGEQRIKFYNPNRSALVLWRSGNAGDDSTPYPYADNNLRNPSLPKAE